MRFRLFVGMSRATLSELRTCFEYTPCCDYKFFFSLRAFLAFSVDFILFDGAFLTFLPHFIIFQDIIYLFLVLPLKKLTSLKYKHGTTHYDFYCTVQYECNL